MKGKIVTSLNKLTTNDLVNKCTMLPGITLPPSKERKNFTAIVNNEDQPGVNE